MSVDFDHAYAVIVVHDVGAPVVTKNVAVVAYATTQIVVTTSSIEYVVAIASPDQVMAGITQQIIVADTT